MDHVHVLPSSLSWILMRYDISDEWRKYFFRNSVIGWPERRTKDTNLPEWFRLRFFFISRTCHEEWLKVLVNFLFFFVTIESQIRNSRTGVSRPRWLSFLKKSIRARTMERIMVVRTRAYVEFFENRKYEYERENWMDGLTLCRWINFGGC